MIQARAVGNAVFLEHAGQCGDIASFSMESQEAAKFAAAQIEACISHYRTICMGFAKRLPGLLAPLSDVWKKKLLNREDGGLVQFDAKGCYDLQEKVQAFIKEEYQWREKNKHGR